MSAPRQSKPEALRGPVTDAPELPDDPWMAPWTRREPGPTQLPNTGRWVFRWRHRTSRTADAESPNPNPPPATPE